MSTVKAEPVALDAECQELVENVQLNYIAKLEECGLPLSSTVVTEQETIRMALTTVLKAQDAEADAEAGK